MEESREFNTKQRQRLASKGKAMKDGSFPIANAKDLSNAVQAYGRASNKVAAKAHIMKRARALGLTKLLPSSWKSDSSEFDVCGQCKTKPLCEGRGSCIKGVKDKSMFYDCSMSDCDRWFSTEKGLQDHAEAVHSHNEVEQLLRTALQTKLQNELGTRPYVYIADAADDWVVYEVEGRGVALQKLLKSSYTIKNGVAEIADGIEVRRRTVYEPVKAAKEK